jgi:predicted nucleotidyltransferase
LEENAMILRLNDLRIRRAEIQHIAAAHGARNVRIFGSVARGQAGPSSDLDVLVDFETGRSLLDLVAFEGALEELLGCKVDVVVEGGISPYLEEQIRGEAVPL